MSVINRMLLELDERRQIVSPAHVPDSVRVVRPRMASTTRNLRWTILALVCGVLLSAVFALWRTTVPAPPAAEAAQAEETFRIAPPAAITPAQSAPANAPQAPSIPSAALQEAALADHTASPTAAAAAGKKQAPASAKSSQYLLPARNDPAPQNP